MKYVILALATLEVTQNVYIICMSHILYTRHTHFVYNALNVSFIMIIYKVHIYRYIIMYKVLKVCIYIYIYIYI